MLRYPKIALGLTIIAIAVIFLGLISLKHLNQSSTFNLTTEQNKFNLKFNFSKQDKNNFSKIIQKLSLPSDATNSLSFGLDSTFSAMLTFKSPIKGEFNVSNNIITFKGELNQPLKLGEQQAEFFRFPKNLNFAYAAENISNNAQKYLSIPPLVTKDIRENSAAAVQIIAFFGPESNGIYIFKTGNFDIDSYKNQPAETTGITLKEETIDGTKFSLLNNLTFFQVGEWTLISTSFDAAKNLFQHQKDPKDSIYFPTRNSSALPSLAVLYQNTSASPVPESLLIAIFGSKEKIPGSLLNIEKIELTVNKKNFNGSIVTKDN